jgi:hypothetical protein
MNTADNLNQKLDEQIAGDPRGRFESHDLASLAARIGASIELTLKILGAGLLRAESPTYKNDPTGRHAFRSDDLNWAKRSILEELIGRVIDESDSEAEVILASSHALKSHKASLADAKGRTKEFSAFPTGVIQLNRLHRDEDDRNIVQRTAGTAAKVAAVGGLAVGGAALLRGRAWQKKIIGRPNNSAAGILSAIRTGAGLNATDAKVVAGRVGTRVVGALDYTSEAARRAAATLRRK